jgi:hypothetical protein
MQPLIGCQMPDIRYRMIYYLVSDTIFTVCKLV